ncbi:hypothetical protein U9M48_004951 [Paspalum notatum var. saurae]|uniref:Fatty acyl-CoA reductase n=1 Tax=Paspalum notatum var. saurae TaxID=547442 RepID=A0AAQ3SI24_PASNO
MATENPLASLILGRCSDDHLVSLAYNPSGIGIKEFLEDKNFLITGGIGFLAKILIEMILRMNPDVGKIYILIKVAGSELFRCMKETHGKDYHSFLAEKLVPVIGDVREANLGIAPDLAYKIADEVDIIVNSALSIYQYDVAMDINTLGAFRIMSFAQRFRRLKLLLHVSTAYVSGQRQGVVMEKPFQLGDTIAKEFGGSTDCKVAALLDIETEVKLALASRIGSDDSASISQEMKRLGLERANLWLARCLCVFQGHGGDGRQLHARRYTGGHHQAEHHRKHPKGPLPRMMDPLILSYGSGQATSCLADPDCVIDVIPADMVVNVMLASMAKHGQLRQGQLTRGMHVCHVSSSTANPMLCKDLFGFFFQHFTRSPFMDVAGLPILVQPMHFCGDMEELSTPATWRTRCCRPPPPGRPRFLRGRSATSMPRLWRESSTAPDSTSPTPSTAAGLKMATRTSLFAEMSAEEREKFHFNVRSVDWMNYITDMHILGLMKYVGKGKAFVRAQIMVMFMRGMVGLALLSS